MNEHDDATPETLNSDSTPCVPAMSRQHDSAPHARVLSNGRYFTVVTGAGTGLSQCGWFAVTRWAGDRVADHDGVLVYLRDVDSGEVWSLGASPVPAAGGTFYARPAPGSVILGRRHDGIETACEVVVPGAADAEVRRLTLRNRSSAARRIEVTFFTEIVAGHRGGDDGHPAFSKLFVETALDAATGVVTARRRPRSNEEAPLWAAATLAGAGDLQVETDRCLFLGRGRTVHAPAALATMAPLSGSTGSVLDPVFALRRTVALAAGEETALAFVLAAGTSGEDAAAAASTLSVLALTDAGAKELVKSAAASERARRKRFGLTGDDADLAQEIAGAMLYAHPALAASRAVREIAKASASPLGRLGLPGDALLVVAPVAHMDGERVALLLGTIAYLRDLGLNLAVALLCDQEDCTAADCVHKDAAAAGHVVLCCAAELGGEACATLCAQARWIADGTPIDFADGGDESAKAKAPRMRAPKADEEPMAIREKLQFDNGYGAFTGDGREYVMRVGPAALAAPEVARSAAMVPPMPWSNIVANERFGFLVTQSGAGYTWAGNSRQNKLTPWSNDSVSDPHGEALYLRDNASGRFWSPLPGPAPSGAWTEARHGMGWSRWMQRSEAVEQEVTMFVAADDPVKVTRVRLANRGSRERSLSLYSIARLVLGVQSNDSSRFVLTSSKDGVLLARNPLCEDHGDAVAFAAVLAGGGSASWTTDRAAFVGRGGSLQAPRAVAIGGSLDGATGGDPCFAFEVSVTLPPRGELEVVFALGQAADADAAAALVAKYREAGATERALDDSKATWKELASAIEVSTPSKSVDLMLNGWLLYQALGCRIHARSAFYQSGGAFGFRDQLQDSAALVYARPDLARAEIVMHAAHQFEEGDVLHWWHPPAPRGTRTRFSDDLLWLPYLAATYIGTTGDESILDEKAGFVRGRELNEGEDEAYLQPSRSTESASVYDHCRRALDRSLTSGAHGLPLMGTGDWNDGMNRVGRLGKGESVWMGFFLTTILDQFIPVAEKRAEWETLRRWRQHRERLAVAVEDSAWDGKWYRRAYYDDGTVLGSAESEECRIDALAQAWSVLSGVASPERATSAMAAVEQHLVDEKVGIIRLLWPPFDKTTHDPGYIKGYVPGIRENGGHYSHAAMWVIRALAKMGERDKAMRWFEMVSPVSHARDRETADLYKVEPYVVAADIYGAAPHLGRGGWTWYTGSAAWMYRTGIESLLGLTIEEGRLLRVKPCIPDSWPGFRLKYRLPDRKTVYDIEVQNPTGCAGKVVFATMGSLTVPVDRGGARLVLRRDGKVHKVTVVLG